MRSTIIRFLGFALLSSGLWVAYSQFGNMPSKLDTVKLKDDLYVIHNDFVPGNTTALITNEGVILVDDKFEIDYANILAELKKITNQPVKYVINTHHHGDHSGGNAAAQKLGTTAIAHENALQNMLDGKQPGVANIGVGNHTRIWLGGKSIETFYFGRSHTNGDISVYFPAQRVLATGDMFTFGDATPELIDYAGGGSAKEWPATVHNALRLDFDTVVPGHGVVTTKAELAKYEQSTITLRNRIHEMIVAKKTRAEMVEVMKKEFHWADLHVASSMDGAMIELRQGLPQPKLHPVNTQIGSIAGNHLIDEGIGSWLGARGFNLMIQTHPPTPPAIDEKGNLIKLQPGDPMYKRKDADFDANTDDSPGEDAC